MRVCRGRVLFDDPTAIGKPPVGDTSLVLAPDVWPAPEEPGKMFTAALGRPRSVAVVGAGITLGVLAAALALPLVAAATVGLGCSLYAALIARDLQDPDFARSVYGPLGAPLRPSVRPEQLQAAELNATYLAILREYETIRAAMQASQGVVDGLRDVYLRCGDLVEAAGRVARSGDALQRYLASQHGGDAEQELIRLASLAAATHDAQAASVYGRAVQARRRQLELHAQIEGLYDRVRARLAVVTSFLAAVEAVVVKLNALDLEQVHDEGSSISDQLDELRGELEVLESSLEDAITGPAAAGQG
jgi:hypothetical protein